MFHSQKGVRLTLSTKSIQRDMVYNLDRYKELAGVESEKYFVVVIAKTNFRHSYNLTSKESKLLSCDHQENLKNDGNADLPSGIQITCVTAL